MLKQILPNKLRGVAALVIGGTLAFTVMGQTASADTLHGFCWGGSTCTDNGTNTPTSTNPPKFGFNGSGSDVTGDFVIDFLIPDNVTKPSSIGLTGTVTGTANLFSPTAWTGAGGQKLADYLGFTGANPTNPIGAFGAGGVTGYFVYQVDLGQQTLGGNSDPSTGPEESTSIGLPVNSYIVAFLNTAPPKGTPDWSATANSGAVLETSDAPPPVPEPGSLLLLCTGLVGAAFSVKRRFVR